MVRAAAGKVVKDKLVAHLVIHIPHLHHLYQVHKSLVGLFLRQVGLICQQLLRLVCQAGGYRSLGCIHIRQVADQYKCDGNDQEGDPDQCVLMPLKYINKPFRIHYSTSSNFSPNISSSALFAINTPLSAVILLSMALA